MFTLVSRIRAVCTGASDGLEGFKAHAVFQEINKKLLEVLTDSASSCDSHWHFPFNLLALVKS